MMSIFGMQNLNRVRRLSIRKMNGKKVEMAEGEKKRTCMKWVVTIFIKPFDVG